MNDSMHVAEKIHTEAPECMHFDRVSVTVDHASDDRFHVQIQLVDTSAGETVAWAGSVIEPGEALSIDECRGSVPVLARQEPESDPSGVYVTDEEASRLVNVLVKQIDREMTG